MFYNSGLSHSYSSLSPCHNEECFCKFSQLIDFSFRQSTLLSKHLGVTLVREKIVTLIFNLQEEVCICTSHFLAKVLLRTLMQTVPKELYGFSLSLVFFSDTSLVLPKCSLHSSSLCFLIHNYI